MDIGESTNQKMPVLIWEFKDIINNNGKLVIDQKLRAQSLNNLVWHVNFIFDKLPRWL